MKKLCIGLFVTSFLLFGMISYAYADPYNDLFDTYVDGHKIVDQHTVGVKDDTYKGYLDNRTTVQYSGYYIGTFENISNVDETLFEKVASAYLGTTLMDDAFYKADPDHLTDGNLTITVNLNELGGTWTLTNSYQIGFYGVKSANQFAFYYVYPYTDSGVWSTEHLLTPNGKNQPEISHLNVSANKVPEPTTILLLGLGLVGLAGTGRKFKK